MWLGRAHAEKLIYLVPQLCHVHPLRSAAVGAAKRLLPRLLWQACLALLVAPNLSLATCIARCFQAHICASDQKQ